MSKITPKRVFRVLLLVGTIVSLTFVPWILVKAWILPLPDTIQDQLDQAIGHGFDGIIVHVDQGGQPPAFYSAGWHDRANKIPADPHALFKIGSIRKLYDAVAVTKLVSDGRLSLDTTLAEFFPELVGRIENAKRITLRMMVQHRSGIPNFTDYPDYWSDPPDDSQAKLELVLDLPASFEPDQGYEYSNTNYLLITRIIEAELGYDKFQFVKEEVLMPLGLTNTFGSLAEVDIDRVMGGYYVGVEHDIKTIDYGMMLATAEDVGVFLRALNDGSLFEDEEKEIYSSIYVYEHGGLIPGYQCHAKYHEDIDTVVVQFVNTTNLSGYTWNLSQIVFGRMGKILKRDSGS